jgi:hypothetical protein
VNGRSRGTGQRRDEREMLRHRETRQPTEQEGPNERRRRRCDGRGVRRGKGEAAGGQQAAA